MLKLDYEALASSSKTLSQQGDTFEDCITVMSQVISELPSIWEAETCDRYVEEFEDAKPTLQKVRQMIEDMSLQMQKISDNFAQADADMAGQMR